MPETWSLAGVFAYPSAAHLRRHGPCGYRNYQAFKPWLRDEFRFRCPFCLLRERWFPNGHAAFSVDHLIPKSVAPDRICDYENLVYACLSCNSARGDQTIVLDPCAASLGDHLAVTDDGRTVGLTTEGRGLIRQLGLDRPSLIEFRGRLLAESRLLQSSQDPRAALLLQSRFGFPIDLPDLRLLRPPRGNLRPEGISSCHLELQSRGQLPDRY